MVPEAALWDLKRFVFVANNEFVPTLECTIQADCFFYYTKVTINEGCVYFKKMGIVA